MLVLDLSPLLPYSHLDLSLLSGRRPGNWHALSRDFLCIVSVLEHLHRIVKLFAGIRYPLAM